MPIGSFCPSGVGCLPLPGLVWLLRLSLAGSLAVRAGSAPAAAPPPSAVSLRCGGQWYKEPQPPDMGSPSRRLGSTGSPFVLGCCGWLPCRQPPCWGVLSAARLPLRCRRTVAQSNDATSRVIQSGRAALDEHSLLCGVAIKQAAAWGVRKPSAAADCRKGVGSMEPVLYIAWDVDGKKVYSGGDLDLLRRKVLQRAKETKDDITIKSVLADGREHFKTFRLLDS